MKFAWKMLLVVLLISQNVSYPFNDSLPRINNITQWAKQKKENAQRLFFCLKNPSLCSGKEVSDARMWLIEVPIALAITIAASAGIVLTIHAIKKMKKKNTIELRKTTAELNRVTALAVWEKNPIYVNTIVTAKDLQTFLTTHQLNVSVQNVARLFDKPEGRQFFVDHVGKEEYKDFKVLLQIMLQIIYNEGLKQFGTSNEFGSLELRKHLDSICHTSRDKFGEIATIFVCKTKDTFFAIDNLNNAFEKYDRELRTLYKQKVVRK